MSSVVLYIGMTALNWIQGQLEGSASRGRNSPEVKQMQRGLVIHPAAGRLPSSCSHLQVNAIVELIVPQTQSRTLLALHLSQVAIQEKCLCAVIHVEQRQESTRSKAYNILNLSETLLQSGSAILGLQDNRRLKQVKRRNRDQPAVHLLLEQRTLVEYWVECSCTALPLSQSVSQRQPPNPSWSHDISPRVYPCCPVYPRARRGPLILLIVSLCYPINYCK
ncbi:uncharacterized protein LOC125258452 [Megalobrama amblycephala]|uniref:uncharacterized protein LOC125258452 n=1 Tax=Megalobrama amblycephala TaxID=75352 RepID=UPI002013DB98|nr:uncharacterized protein LOC125258452 [Megalobrama amblycephala]